MKSLTVAILTKNEECHIEAVIANAKQCTDDILVIDSGSTDKTVEMAKKCGARVVFRELNNDFAAQRDFALQCSEADWVFYLDADERFDDCLVREIKEILKSDKMDHQYACKRVVVENGKRITFGIYRPDEVTRFFPRQEVRWVNKVHEHAESKLSKVLLKGKLDHYTNESWEQRIRKINQYTMIWSEQKYAEGKRVSRSSVVMRTIFAFFKAYILCGGIFSGSAGLISSWQHSFYTLAKYDKLHEWQLKEKKKK